MKRCFKILTSISLLMVLLINSIISVKAANTVDLKIKHNYENNEIIEELEVSENFNIEDYLKQSYGDGRYLYKDYQITKIERSNIPGVDVPMMGTSIITGSGDINAKIYVTLPSGAVEETTVSSYGDWFIEAQESLTMNSVISVIQVEEGKKDSCRLDVGTQSLGRMPSSGQTEVVCEGNDTEYNVIINYEGPYYLVSLDLNYEGAEALEGLLIKEESYIDQLITPEREGYNFLGWYYRDSVWDNTENLVLTDMTLKAQWEEVEKLPQTSFYEMNYYLIGVIFVILGIGIYVYTRKKQKQ